MRHIPLGTKNVNNIPCDVNTAFAKFLWFDVNNGVFVKVILRHYSSQAPYKFTHKLGFNQGFIDTLSHYYLSNSCNKLKSFDSIRRLLQVTKTGYSRLREQHTLYLHLQRLPKALLMALALLLSHTPVNSDVTMSTAQGTYFQNEGPGRK